MDRRQHLWHMTAEQFAAFDVQLYLDTHPGDRNALHLFNSFQNNYQRARKEFEAKYGPLSADAAEQDSWCWVNDPWPWEREAN
ncbi:MAG: spore coat protein CotJB [Oscillospiraceae bacterium]|nr:spore coat protein CotJB [Oscillospiraceae bacterium]